MTNEEFDRRIERLTERHEALAQSVELLRGSVSDLTASVHAMVADTRERETRDRQYFKALAALLGSWGGEKNGGKDAGA